MRTKAVVRLGLLDEDASDALAELYSARVLADYFPDEVSPDHAHDLLVSARQIVNRVLGNA
ncbi:MAG: hypothetical protein A3I00_08055 [Betaproteobacteria bacterium RIFCSPLOWO2_02_FULL_64_12]|nr:MAG: hypothetical protein A3I00_08055 [Betaproteobacteria bacterium RIFCSPLOWO2_02_FULL_64_12]